MNKYQEALNTMCKRCANHFACQGTGCQPKKNLQELVDLATPKKPIKKYYVETSKKFGTIKKVDFRCPNCKTALTNGVHNSLGIAADIETKFIEVIKDRRYCSVCGKAIDWSDEK